MTEYLCLKYKTACSFFLDDLWNYSHWPASSLDDLCNYSHWTASSLVDLCNYSPLVYHINWSLSLHLSANWVSTVQLNLFLPWYIPHNNVGFMLVLVGCFTRQSPHLSKLKETRHMGSRLQGVGSSGVARILKLPGHRNCTLPKAAHRGA